MRKIKGFMTLVLAIVLLCGTALPAHAYGGLFGGGKKPKPGDRVEVSADDRSSEGLVFDHWEANTDKVVFNDPYSPNTWFIVPDGVKDIDINPVFRGVTPVPTVEPTPKPTPRAQTGEISDSWEQIIAAIDDGSAQQRYAIGATKELKLSGIGTIHMQLAGFDLDERADGNGKAPTTWIAVELLPEKHLMNSESTSDGGWQDSDLRAYLHDTLLPTIPAAVQRRLMLVKKHQKDVTGYYQITEDLVWIPDYDELFGNGALYYDLFRNSHEKLEKGRTGTPIYWWLRSAYCDGLFYTVHNVGNSGTGVEFDAYGVALGFCL